MAFDAPWMYPYEDDPYHEEDDVPTEDPGYQNWREHSPNTRAAVPLGSSGRQQLPVIVPPDSVSDEPDRFSRAADRFADWWMTTDAQVRARNVLDAWLRS